MGRFNPQLKERIMLAWYVFHGTKGSDIFTMNCPYCHGIKFKRDSVVKETPFIYQAIYTCQRCKRTISEIQIIT